MERLQKILARAGVTARRKAELLMKEGRVTVNGRIVTEMGAKADPVRDRIKVNGKLIHPHGRKVYILLNKPRGVITAASDPRGRTTVLDLVKTKERIFPVGRLDYNTEGLLLLTNDGDVARVVSCAGSPFAKVYEVRVRSAPEPAALERLRAGMRLGDGTQLTGCRIRRLRQGSRTWLEVTLTQGKNRQIRRMFDSIGHPVLRLRRRRIGFLTDQGLPTGGHRPLTDFEVARLHRFVRRVSSKDKGPPQNNACTLA